MELPQRLSLDTVTLLHYLTYRNFNSQSITFLKSILIVGNSSRSVVGFLSGLIVFNMLYLHQVVGAIEKRHGAQQEGASQTHFHAVFQSLIDTALSAIEGKIEYISQKVSDRVSESC